MNMNRAKKLLWIAAPATAVALVGCGAHRDRAVAEPRVEAAEIQLSPAVAEVVLDAPKAAAVETEKDRPRDDAAAAVMVSEVSEVASTVAATPAVARPSTRPAAAVSRPRVDRRGRPACGNVATKSPPRGCS